MINTVFDAKCCSFFVLRARVSTRFSSPLTTYVEPNNMAPYLILYSYLVVLCSTLYSARVIHRIVGYRLPCTYCSPYLMRIYMLVALGAYGTMEYGIWELCRRDVP